jgi:hypothetical protein
MFAKLSKSVQSMFQLFQPRRPKSDRRPVSPSLQVEALEERWTPSVLRPAVINYSAGGVLYENVFIEKNEGLFLKIGNGSQFGTVANLASPAGTSLPYGSPAAINYGKFENVFVTDSSGNVDYVSTSNEFGWTWGKLGNPGTPLVTNGYSNPAVANYQVGSALHENVFAIDRNGKLDLRVFNGAVWQSWVSLGNPGIQLTQNASPVVINYGSYENVFATDILGNLHYAYTPDGTHWTWVYLGNDGAPAYGEPAVNNYQVGSVLHETAFVTDSNGRLGMVDWNGSSWHWGPSLGISSLSLVGTPAVINYGSFENVFVRDSSGNLELTNFNGFAWHTFWNMGHTGSGVFTDPAVINVQLGSALHENVFYYDGGDLNLLAWNGSSWQPWQNLGLI